MKKTRWFIASLLAAALVFGSCSSDSDDDDDDSSASSSSTTSSTTSASSTTYATLPSSVGENEVGSKTWTHTGSSSISSWIFTDSTAKYVQNVQEGLRSDESFVVTRTYSYSYDSTKSLIYLTLKSFSYKDSSTDYSYSSVAEFKSLLEKGGLSGDELEREVAEVTAMFATRVVYKYEISDSSIEFYHYFDGSLPTDVAMSYHDYESSSYTIIGTHREGEFEIRCDEDYDFYPSFSNGSFSGTIYNDEGSSLGTAAGTYETSGTGTTGCSITLTFTTLPSDLDSLNTNNAYTLEQGEYEDKFHDNTYTLEQ